MLRKRGINIRILTIKSLIKDFKFLNKECIYKGRYVWSSVVSDVCGAMIIIGLARTSSLYGPII